MSAVKDGAAYFRPRAPLDRRRRRGAARWLEIFRSRRVGALGPAIGGYRQGRCSSSSSGRVDVDAAQRQTSEGVAAFADDLERHVAVNLAINPDRVSHRRRFCRDPQKVRHAVVEELSLGD